MQKIQILFTNPLMGIVRAVADEEDRPASEVVRRAVERFLEMNPAKHLQTVICLIFVSRFWFPLKI